MSTNLTKREIVLDIYKKTNFPQKQIVETVQLTLDIIQQALADGRNVELRNFGVLEVQRRKSRIGRNPSSTRSIGPAATLAWPSGRNWIVRVKFWAEDEPGTGTRKLALLAGLFAEVAAGREARLPICGAPKVPASSMRIWRKVLGFVRRAIVVLGTGP